MAIVGHLMVSGLPVRRTAVDRVICDRVWVGDTVKRADRLDFSLGHTSETSAFS